MIGDQRWRPGKCRQAAECHGGEAGRPGCRGFTLIELLVVLSILALLLTLAVPRYLHSIEVSKEAVLRENLHLVRETIDKFYGDKGRYPDSLEELVSEKYLRSLPYDPITESTSTWTLIAPDAGDVGGGVYDLKSGAIGAARDGKPFADL
ncbi:MAG: prepilin-type N-terminal cleavage/methylation domain-containing protein [Candidatus Accumulibacter sp.]|uniref:type II secretion system protein n=1 Tax=Accumulibacter sp. TaxID=2053492 RepID=UPI001A058C18|nr:prepilin-type N-terminal cleavage/methylation domain-containing protein [Accumulibacter sp.]MBE2257978.1 prepilin-type N-terminal cleavage/methylation domain-containing protein [Paracoccaceae bacterium]MCB1943619.1 prepilin-type N-terminal cleavage/methylation domain-containing protein [Accumulibacter sp.]MCP5247557.1 prepilin-type N-terminal cleavage/methylation domain-containing protein [Accumulibacter sp.]